MFAMIDFKFLSSQSDGLKPAWHKYRHKIVFIALGPGVDPMMSGFPHHRASSYYFAVRSFETVR